MPWTEKTSGKCNNVVIIRDTREQTGYTFDGPRYEGVAVEAGSLNAPGAWMPS